MTDCAVSSTSARHLGRAPLAWFGRGSLIAGCWGLFAVGILLGAFLSWTSGGIGVSTKGHVDLSFWAIFSRNVGVMASMAAGVLTLGVLTVGVLGMNGLVCGAAIQTIAGSGGTESLMTGLAPHFLPEVAAFCVAAAADLCLVGTVLRWIRQGVRPKLTGETGLVVNWLIPHGMALGLLVVAAAVESHISAVG